MLDAVERIGNLGQFIDFGQYFVIHAARQSGKTTLLQDMTSRLNSGGKYYALYCSLEGLQGITDVEKGIPQIVKIIRNCLLYTQFPHNTEFAADADFSDSSDVLRMEISKYCNKLDKPLIIFFDEADCLSEQTLITFLRQLRNGYNSRGTAPFIHSLALVGMRNIRDFKARVRPDSQTLGSASPFNIVAASVTLRNFTQEEDSMLYRQHTDDKGQQFENGVVETVFEQTQGQPWLVNAIAREITFNQLNLDYSPTITVEMVDTAIKTIIKRRDTHIDSLLERLKEERVKKIIEPVMLGEFVDGKQNDDYLYVRDLGLIREDGGVIRPANPIYAEVIARTLNYDSQADLQQERPTYQMPRYLKNGKIDMEFLMSDFQEFWRENSDIWVEKYFYKEAAPHLILMAFLQRVINGGGKIIREMASGRKRLDLYILYEGQKYPIEIKLWNGEKVLERGIAQTSEYMDMLGCNEGTLAIFDRRPKRSWSKKLYIKHKDIDDKKIMIVGL